ncbi:MAG: response regulator transcription factor [Bacteroidia bacterium]|nr:response regulator transcription factor [Bacteroidia bacterium]
MKILIVEDEKALADSILTYLEQEGNICEAALDFQTASEKISLYRYDCLIIDLTLPGGNGLTLINELKATESEAGVIIISAKDSTDDKIIGLDIGADDYLTKPFHLSELNARIKSLMRRRSFSGKREIIIDEIRIIPDLFQVFVNNSEVVLTKKEYDLLMYFLTNKNRVLTKESIAEHLWGDDIDMADSYDFIYTHIKNLRRKIMETGGSDYIETIYKMGYKFKAS